MVDPDLFVMGSHVVDTDMASMARVEMACYTLAKEGSTEHALAGQETWACIPRWRR